MPRKRTIRRAGNGEERNSLLQVPRSALINPSVSWCVGEGAGGRQLLHSHLKLDLGSRSYYTEEKTFPSSFDPLPLLRVIELHRSQVRVAGAASHHAGLLSQCSSGHPLTQPEPSPTPRIILTVLAPSKVGHRVAKKGRRGVCSVVSYGQKGSRTLTLTWMGGDRYQTPFFPCL